jgi:hypothetical protein
LIITSIFTSPPTTFKKDRHKPKKSIQALLFFHSTQKLQFQFQVLFSIHLYLSTYPPSQNKQRTTMKFTSTLPILSVALALLSLPATTPRVSHRDNTHMVKRDAQATNVVNLIAAELAAQAMQMVETNAMAGVGKRDANGQSEAAELATKELQMMEMIQGKMLNSGR